MESFKFVRARQQSDLARFYPVLKELRKDLSYAQFLDIYHKANTQNRYELIGLEDESGRVLAVMGYRVLYDFVHGMHLYVDDLVATESERSRGLGARLLSHAEFIAKELGCSGMRLCTGVDNERGKQFYERNDWNLRAVAFKKRFQEAHP